MYLFFFSFLEDGFFWGGLVLGFFGLFLSKRRNSV